MEKHKPWGGRNVREDVRVGVKWRLMLLCGAAVPLLNFWFTDSVSQHLTTCTRIDQKPTKEVREKNAQQSLSLLWYPLFLDLSIVFQANSPTEKIGGPARAQVYFVWNKKYFSFQNPRLIYFTFFQFLQFSLLCLFFHLCYHLLLSLSLL